MKLSYEQMGEMVKNALVAMGGSGTHAQLTEALPAENRQVIAMQYRALRQIGYMRTVVKNVDGKLQTVFSVEVE